MGQFQGTANRRVHGVPLFLFGVKGGKSCRGGMGTPTMTRRGAGKRPGVQTGSWPSARCAAILLQERPLLGHDAPTTARTVGLPPRGGQYFLSKRKKVPKKASGTATPEAARPAARYSQISAFRALPCPALVFAQACQSLTAYGSCAHWARAPSRPKLRPAGAERLDDPNLFGASNSGR